MTKPLHPVFTQLQAWEAKLVELRTQRRAAKRSAPRYWTQESLAADKQRHGVVDK